MINPTWIFFLQEMAQHQVLQKRVCILINEHLQRENQNIILFDVRQG